MTGAPSDAVAQHCITVCAFTGGTNIPSARFRVRQYCAPLRGYGIQLAEFPSAPGAYPPQRRSSRLWWAVRSVSQRIPAVVQSYTHDLTLFQREMLSTFVTLEPFTSRPRVLDVDDAVWLRRNGAFARRIAGLCSGLLCGNHFLAETLQAWNRRVTVIPTAVDTQRFRPGAERQRPSESGVICWSGTSGGFVYFEGLQRALRTVLSRRPGRRLRIISNKRPDFPHIPGRFIEYVPWSANTEVASLQDADVGIMPLDDTAWSRGKCSYKMLTYMACGIPVAASPIGMNAEVLSKGGVGFGPRSEDEWVDALEFLLSHPEEAARMGSAGRQVVEQEYSLSVLAPVLANALRRFADT